MGKVIALRRVAAHSPTSSPQSSLVQLGVAFDSRRTRVLQTLYGFEHELNACVSTLGRCSEKINMTRAFIASCMNAWELDTLSEMEVAREKLLSQRARRRKSKQN